MWTKKSFYRLSTILYILCRYAMVANVLYLLSIAGQLGSSCDVWYKFIGAISVVARAAVLSMYFSRILVPSHLSQISSGLHHAYVCNVVEE
jgi:hypothetical protein